MGDKTGGITCVVASTQFAPFSGFSLYPSIVFVFMHAQRQFFLKFSLFQSYFAPVLDILYLHG